MDRFVCKMIAALLLLPAAQACARDWSGMVSPSVGVATVSNISGYKDAAFARVDAAFFPTPEFGVGVFGIGYDDFKTDSNSSAGADIKVDGFGISVTGRWPLHPRVAPYARAEYMRWSAEATALGQKLARQRGGSPGITLGLQFPIVQFPVLRSLGVKVEFSAYNKISDADIRQISSGLILEF